MVPLKGTLLHSPFRKAAGPQHNYQEKDTTPPFTLSWSGLTPAQLNAHTAVDALELLYNAVVNVQQPKFHTPPILPKATRRRREEPTTTRRTHPQVAA